MAANYWASTQRRNWCFGSDQLADIREDMLKNNARIIEQFPYPDRRLMFIFMRDRLLQLGKRLSFRQQCVATALTYLQRFFLFRSMQNVNIYLVIATAFYLASKTEESPHHIRLVASEARQAWPDFIPSDVSRLGEMEFCLISEMHSQLIVWHPYRTLMALKERQDLSLTNEELVLAWSIVNDTYMTDLPLTCPPYLIAVTALFLAIIFVPNKSNLNFSTSSLETQATRDSSDFVGLGGRPGVARTFSNANNTLNGNNQKSSEESAPLDGSSMKSKIVLGTLSSEKLQRTIKFIVESDVELDQMISATQEIISLYEVWESYNDKTLKDTISSCLKTRGLTG